MTQFKPVTVEKGLQLLGIDTMTPAGIYFRPFTQDELKAGAGYGALAFPGDFFLLVHKEDGAPRVSLLPWTAPAFGNQYPKGDHGVAGEAFDPREIAGPWVPFRPIPKTESVTGTYIGAEHFEDVTGGLRSQLHEAEQLLGQTGEYVGILRGALGLALDGKRATAAKLVSAPAVEQLGTELPIRAEALLREIRLRRSLNPLQDFPTIHREEALS